MIPRNVVRNLSVTLDVPLALMASLRVLQHFGVKQNPFPPSRRLGSNSRIVLLEVSENWPLGARPRQRMTKPSAKGDAAP
jgi:hypothetical protein